MFVMEKSKGNEVIDKIKEYAYAYGVPYSNILFDNDGVGQFVDGFIDGANEFNNGGTVLPNNDTGEKENYKLIWEKNNLNIKIGNANRLISGNHVYTISYMIFYFL